MRLSDSLTGNKFRALWAGQLVSKLGDVVHEIAILYLTYVVTGKPKVIAFVAIASLGSTALLSLPAGTLVDRWSKRRILVVSAAIRGVAVLMIPFAQGSGYLIETVIAVAIVSGAAQAFTAPARDAIIPVLVDDNSLDSANALVQITDAFGNMLYVVGGVVIALIGPITAFYVNAVSFGISALLFIALPVGKVAGEESTPLSLDRIASEVRDGIAFFRNHHALPSVFLLTALVGFALGPLGVVIPFYAENTLEVAVSSATNSVNLSTTFGLLYTSVYVGVLIGGMGINGIQADIEYRRGECIISGVFGMGITLAALSIVTLSPAGPLATACILLTGFGFAASVVQVLTTTFVQSALPSDRHGKAFSIIAVGGLATPPIGVAVAGIALELTSAANVFVAQGAFLLVSALLFLATPIRFIGQESTGSVVGQ